MKEKITLSKLVLVAVMSVLTVAAIVYLWPEDKVISNDSSESTVVEEKYIRVEKEKEEENLLVDEDTVIHSDTELPFVEEEEEGPLFYTFGENVIVSQKEISFPLSAEDLSTMMNSCGLTRSNNYFKKLYSTFSDARTVVYEFEYPVALSQEPRTYKITLVENKAGYSSMEEFNAVFEGCSASGDFYPKMLNDEWLVFENSCGKDIAYNAENPVGCSYIKGNLEKSLMLNKYDYLFQKHLYKAHYSQWYLVSNENGIEKYEMGEGLYPMYIDDIAGISYAIDKLGSFKMYTKDNPIFSKDPNVEIGGLLGAWDLNENGELIFNFDNGDKIEYQILSIDEDNLIMERKSSTMKALNYTDLSVCGDFQDYEVATDAGFYSVARTADNGECLFILNSVGIADKAECIDNEEVDEHPWAHSDCFERKEIFYNVIGQEIEEEEIAVSKPISEEDYKKATAK